MSSYPIIQILCGRGVVWNAINEVIIIIIIGLTSDLFSSLAEARAWGEL
jgi:hypothetical protein